MANFSESTSLYEILIRVQNTGAWAAQYQTLTEIKKDDLVISSSVSDVAPLTKQNIEAFTIVKELIGKTAADTLSENQELRDLLSQAKKRIAELELLIPISYEPVQQNGGA